MSLAPFVAFFAIWALVGFALYYLVFPVLTPSISIPLAESGKFATSILTGFFVSVFFISMGTLNWMDHSKSK